MPATKKGDDISSQREQIRGLVKKGVSDSWAGAAAAPGHKDFQKSEAFFSAAASADPTPSPEKSVGFPALSRPMLDRKRVLSSIDSEESGWSNSVVNSGAGEKGGEEDPEDDEETASQNKAPEKKWTSMEFLYSSEVDTAVQKMKERYKRKRVFGRAEVHIFHLPEIVKNGAPRVPFTPSVFRSMKNNGLPKPGHVQKMPKMKKKVKHFSQDQYGYYLSWRATQTDTSTPLMPKPLYVPKRHREFRELPDSAKRELKDF